MRRPVAIFACGIALLLFVPMPATVSSQGPPYWQIEDLGTLNSLPIMPRDINAGGHVVGVVSGEDPHGFLYTSGPDPVEVPGFGHGHVEANAINDNDVIVGSALDAGSQIQAFRYTTTGGTTGLGMLSGAMTSRAFAINASGQVAGYSGDSAFHAFRYTDGVPMEDLGTLGGVASYGYGINNAGYVVGCSDDENAYWRAFVGPPGGVMQDLGTLGGWQACAIAINATGQIVGWSEQTDGNREAFRVTTGSPMQGLGRLGFASSQAFDVNDAGDVAGLLVGADGSQHAFLYTDAVGLVDLNDRIDPALGWVLAQALAVNNAGQIVGIGSLNGEWRTFRLTPPAPEPPPPPTPETPPPTPPPPPPDTEPPTIDKVTPKPAVLWPPFGQMVHVRVRVAATDNTDPSPACHITGVTSNQPDQPKRHGWNRQPDFVVTGDLTLKLRSELTLPRRTDRIYTIALACADEAGNTARATATVRVARIPVRPKPAPRHR